MNNLPIKLQLPEGFLDEEERCGYTISSDMKTLWAVELDLLNELQRVCEKHGLTYYACAGTMLGAARHQGIIPWDDDLDIMMFRDDYRLLCEHMDEFKGRYFLQTEYNDKGSLRGHAQLRNSETTAILKDDYNGEYAFNQGIFIDIFPLDSIPDNADERSAFFEKLKKKRLLTRKFRDFSRYKRESNSKIKRIIKAIISPFVSAAEKTFGLSHNTYVEYERLMQKYNGKDSKEVGILALLALGNRFIWERSDFDGEDMMLPFEMTEIPVPAGYIHMLEKSYGDWRKMVKAKTNHGDTLFDPHKSYREYMKQNI